MSTISHRHRFTTALFALLALTLAPLAQAQLDTGTKELGIFGNYSHPTSGGDGLGTVFGNFGYFATKNIKVDVGGGGVWAAGDVTGFASVGLSYFWPAEVIAPYVTANYLHGIGDVSFNAASVGVGMYQFFGERVAIDYSLRYQFETGSVSDGVISFNIGLKIFFE